MVRQGARVVGARPPREVVVPVSWGGRQRLDQLRDRLIGTRWSRVRHSRSLSWAWARWQNWHRYSSRANRKVLVTWRRNLRGTWTNLTRRMIAGLGSEIRGLRISSPASASTISALPSITSRSARLTGTIVRGSNEAFRARQRMLNVTGFPRGGSRRAVRRSGGRVDDATADHGEQDIGGAAVQW